MSQAPVLLFLLPFVAALVSAALMPFTPRLTRGLAIGALVATTGVAIAALARVHATGTLRMALGGWGAPIGIELVLDPLAAALAVLVSGMATAIVWGGASLVRAELPGREPLVTALSLLLVAGLLGIIVTGDLFNLFVHLEVASLSAYALVAAGDRGAARAGLRYLLIGSFGATLLLAGIGFLYAATGTLNMSDVAARIGSADPRVVRTGGLLVVVGLAVKMGLYPLHLWMPSAYARGPLAAAALMAPLVTKVSAYALLRILFWTLGLGTVVGQVPLAEITAWLGAAAIVAGGGMAFVQTDLRRLFAYSSVGQIGIVAVGIGLADVPGLTGAVLHIAGDAVVKGALFLAAGVAALRFGVTQVDELSRLRQGAPWTSAAIAIAGLSLVGIPPLAGFYGKWYVLNAAVSEGRWPFVAAIVVGSLASIGYVFRVFEQLYFTPVASVGLGASGASGAADTPVSREGPLPLVLVTVGCAVAVVVLGVANAEVVARFVLPALPQALLP